MESKILIHKNTNYSKIISKYIFALIPLILYGIYKNGVILYVNKEITFLSIFKPLLFPMLGVFASILVNIITKKKNLLNTLLLEGLLVGMVVPLNTNIIVFALISLVGLYVSALLEQKIKFNAACLIKLVLVFVLFIMNKYGYANSLELAGTYAYSFIDLLFGRQVGGVCSTSVVWIITGFLYLITDYYYQKEIPIVAYISYAIVCAVSLVFTKDLNQTLNLLIAAMPMFVFAFIAPISEYSPYTNNGKYVFAILLGILTALLNFVVGLESAFIAVLVLSLLKNPIDNLVGQKITK